MGKGKGRRRRQQNYLAAHGGHVQLPTPPTASDVAAIPSKLRRIISLKASPPGHLSLDSSKSQNKSIAKNLHGSKGTTSKQHKNRKIEKQEDASKVEKQEVTSSQMKDGEEIHTSKESVPKQKKRKREDELQFLSEKFRATPIRKGLNDRKKKYLQDKKNKRKKSTHFNSMEANHTLHKQEKITFGDIVDAPPKLSFPKKQKTAAEERLRQQAIETYREKKKWFSRPGNHQPPPLTNDSILSS
eukprot:c24339_g3_i2 orf=709-1437(-)